MAKRTNKYGLTYFEEGDITDAQYEMQRWETLDSQLQALFSIMGNGVLRGWNIQKIENGGLSCSISPGAGHVGFIAVESSEAQNITGLNASSVNYIYAQLNTDSYWTKSVSFVSFSSKLNVDISQNLYLGSVEIDDVGIVVDGIDISEREELGFLNLINNAISAHKHNGGENNPQPIDLSSEVQGIISQNNLPELDASLITTGEIDVDRLPLLDHEKDLINQGSLTHAQLDSFIETLSIENPSLMGEVSTVNLLQLILSLKHIYPDIDEYLVNEISFIPGISPDDYIDAENTTAIVDTRTYAQGGQHTITGENSDGFKSYSKKWVKQGLNSAELSGTLFNGNLITLATTENEKIIDDFNSISNWAISTENLSDINANLTQDSETYYKSPYSGKVSIGSESVDVQLLIEKSISVEDWSGYDYLTFRIYTGSIEHGDVYFYLRDVNYGEQNSNQIVLNRNSATINEDTLDIGWQEVKIDIRDFDRENIELIGLYVSTQEGWDTSKGFDLNIDEVKLTSGNIYEEYGYARFIFGSNIPVKFWRLRWDDKTPTDELSSGVSIKARTRVSNTEVGLETSNWSSYFFTSGSEIDVLEDVLYKFIEVEFYFSASSNMKRSVDLTGVYIDYYAVDSEQSFEINSKSEWESGILFNIDTDTVAGDISIKNSSDFGDIFYGSNGMASQIDENLQEKYKITGTTLPRSTNQALNNLPSSLGLITAVERGNNGNIWISDIDNDRVYELNKYGEIVFGLQGSFLDTPVDNYKEDMIIDEPVSEDSASNISDVNFNVLHSIFNSNDGVLYVVFDNNLENIYETSSVFDISKFYIKVGTQKIWLDESSVELLGANENKYNLWNAPTTSENTNYDEYFVNLNKFKFSSHVLKITISGANKTLLNYLVNQKTPSISIASPKPNEMIDNFFTAKFLLRNFYLGSSSGDNAIQVTINGVSNLIYSDTYVIGPLNNGVNNIKVKLINGDGSINSNIESEAETDFIVGNYSSYELPHMSILTPFANQIYSSSPVNIEFLLKNFPILPSGQHIRYKVDNGNEVDFYSEDNIILEGLSNGLHDISIWTVDKNGNKLTYDYSEASAKFIVGTNSNANTKLYIGENAIANSNGTSFPNLNYINVDIENIKFVNLYSPIDIHLIPSESSVNNDGSPTIVIAKLRSQSSLSGLGEEANAAEINNRIANSLQTEGQDLIVLNPDFDETENSDLVYGDSYLDGYSVVQYDMNGNVVFSNNEAIFADSKENAKNYLGSVEKISNSELLIGDSINKRAIISNTDLSTKQSKVIWEYNSDRFVVDFRLNIQSIKVIQINDGYVDTPISYISPGQEIKWTNNSASPVTIYSGLTTYEDFLGNPNLNLYGDDFKSSVLNSGDSYIFKFNQEGNYSWFTYPSILTGYINVTSQRLSEQDQFLILESDGLESPFSSRVIKVDSWGNAIWTFGEGYLVKPRDVRPLANNNVLISV